MQDPPIKRRLTAILAADAVGYSARMGEDEERTLRTLAGHRKIIDALIADHGGRIVGTAGDSVLAEFGSSVEAVRCAVEIQEALATRNEGLAPDDRLHFRIGINLGDVLVEGSDILGDGVNVASRLEGIAEPGGFCFS
jgi:class 3 adenylate cyclase